MVHNRETAEKVLCVLCLSTAVVITKTRTSVVQLAMTVQHLAVPVAVGVGVAVLRRNSHG